MKIHRVRITDCNLKYEGSLTVAADLMEKCGLIPYERILCSNMANRNRLRPTPFPAIPVRAIVRNGAAAFHGKRGDFLTIMSLSTSPKARCNTGSRASSCSISVIASRRNAELNPTETVSKLLRGVRAYGENLKIF